MRLPSLHFVYVGDSLPYYGRAALQLAHRSSGLHVVLIGTGSMRDDAKSAGVDFVDLRDFYDPSAADRAAPSILQPRGFRDGFWLKTLERFFVLEQFMRWDSASELLHAELDQLLFRVDEMAIKLAQGVNRGVFVPFHGADTAVASVFYCNERATLAGMLDFIAGGRHFPNEMKAIAEWGLSNPKACNVLPTLPYALDHALPPPSLRGPTPADIGGVVDAAQLGQWIAGIDPRNLPPFRSHLNKFADDFRPLLLSRAHLSALTFRLDSEHGFLLCSTPEGSTIRVYNLHLHSKLHARLVQGRPTLEELLRLSNNPNRARMAGTLGLRLAYFGRDRIAPVLTNPGAAARSAARRLLGRWR